MKSLISILFEIVDLSIGSAAVLGLPQPVCHKLTEKGIPIEQAIGKQRLRPGSGFLSVEINMDGPTRVLTIKDMKETRSYATSDEREWGLISQTQRPIFASSSRQESVDDDVEKSELQFTVDLYQLGISLVCRRTPEELLYVVFTSIVGETVQTPTSKRFCVSVGNVQVDNQVRLIFKSFNGSYK